MNHSGTKHYSQIASVNVRQVADDEQAYAFVASPVRYGGERSVGSEEDDRQVTGIPLTPHSGPLDDGATCGVHHSFARELVLDSRASPQQCCLGMECSDPVPCPPTAAFAPIEPPFESLLTFLNMEDGNEGF